MTSEKQEKNNQLIAWLTSAGIHVLIGLLLFFVIAWKAPDPPLSERGGGGIELNFGLDDVGYGEVQPETPVGSEGTQEEEPQQVEEEQPKQEVVEPAQTKPAEELTADDEESPVTTKEKEPKKEEPKVVEKPKEVKKEPVEQKENPATVYKPNTKPTESSNKTNEGKTGSAGNHGDDPGTTGDKGNPQGSLDAKALYGDPGSGGGSGGGVFGSGLTGFDWPKIQTPKLPDNAVGVYEFIVKVDDQGDVISVTSLQRGLSVEAERSLKAMIQKLVFIPKGTNLPPQSEGRITFKVVAK
jgi:hypothetical protein